MEEEVEEEGRRRQPDSAAFGLWQLSLLTSSCPQAQTWRFLLLKFQTCTSVPPPSLSNPLYSASRDL